MTDEIYQLISPTAGTLTKECDFSGFTSSGFDLNWGKVDGAARPIAYLTIKGGTWEVGTDTTPNNSTGVKTYTTANEPIGMAQFSWSNAASASIATTLLYSFGATDGTDENVVTLFSQNNLVGSNCVSRMSLSHVFWASWGTQESASFDSFNPTSFKLNYDNSDANQRQFCWFVVSE